MKTPRGKAAKTGGVFGKAIGGAIGKEGGKFIGNKIGGKYGGAVGGAIGGEAGKIGGQYAGRYGGYAAGKGYHYTKPIAVSAASGTKEVILGSFKKGGKVHKTGNYLLHKGEYVIPNLKKGSRRSRITIKG